MKYFEAVVEWKKVAAFLLNDEDGSIIATIESTNRKDVNECRESMIREYLKKGKVSWQHVLKSLKNANYTNLATKIHTHLGTTGTYVICKYLDYCSVYLSLKCVPKLQVRM